MLTFGVARSATVKAVPPDLFAMNFAVSGVICMSPSAPADEVRGRKCVSR